MKHTICFIDDKIPVAQYAQYFKDTDIINESVIQFLLKQEDADWQDTVIKKLCERLLAEREDWSISAFVNPNFYQNYSTDTVFAPDVVIYDWDYPGLQEDSETILLHILQNTPALIFIFSEGENIENIVSTIASEKFIPFQERLVAINKNDNQSVDTIFAQIQAKESANFAFAYGGQIIRKSNQIINKILSDISQLSTESFIAAIGKEENNRYVSTTNDFVDVIIPRYKNALNSVPGNDGDTIAIEKSRDINIDEIKKIWSYKMYEKNSSDAVSMGDIVKSNDGNYYLVISSDCHMQDFWKKNGGNIALVPLEQLSPGQKNEQVHYLAEDRTITSLTNYKKAMTVLPAVPIQNNQQVDFVALPKGITTIKLMRPNDSQKILTYANFTGFSKITTVSDPFKSPLFYFIMNNISDMGCPDFPEKLKKNLTDLVKSAK